MWWGWDVGMHVLCAWWLIQKHLLPCWSSVIWHSFLSPVHLFACGPVHCICLFQLLIFMVYITEDASVAYIYSRCHWSVGVIPLWQAEVYLVMLLFLCGLSFTAKNSFFHSFRTYKSRQQEHVAFHIILYQDAEPFVYSSVMAGWSLFIFGSQCDPTDAHTFHSPSVGYIKCLYYLLD